MARLRRFLVPLLLGTLAAFVLLELGLRAVGWAFLGLREARNREAVAGGGAVVLCIGESTTALGGEDSYPEQLRNVLDERVGPGRFTVVNKGVPSADSSIVVDQLEANLDAYHPVAVAAMLGANDRGGAIPIDRLPRAEQTGFPYTLRSLRLLRQLRHEPGAEAPLSSVPVPPKPGQGPPLPGSPGAPELPPEGEEARRLAQAGETEAAVAAYAAAVEKHPRDAVLAGDAAKFLRKQAKYDEAERVLLRALERCPSCDDTWNELAQLYEGLTRDTEAEAAFRKAAEADPSNADAFFGLGRALWKEERCDEAIPAFEHALAVRPRDAMTLGSLGICYEKVGRIAEAEAVLRQSLELDPQTRRSYIRLADFFENQGKDAEARALFDHILRVKGDDDYLLGRIQLYFLRRGDHEEAARWAARADALRDHSYCAATRDQYRKMHELLRSRGILLLAVQYPTRPVEPLRYLLDSEEGVVFVSNESDFREALESRPYEELFWDNCYGDFGHCTRSGNRILAENVADALLAALPAP